MDVRLRVLCGDGSNSMVDSDLRFPFLLLFWLLWRGTTNISSSLWVLSPARPVHSQRVSSIYLSLYRLWRYLHSETITRLPCLHSYSPSLPPHIHRILELILLSLTSRRRILRLSLRRIYHKMSVFFCVASVDSIPHFSSCTSLFSSQCTPTMYHTAYLNILYLASVLIFSGHFTRRLNTIYSTWPVSHTEY